MAEENHAKRRRLSLWIALAVVAVLLAFGIVPRVLQNSELQASAKAEKSVLPQVELVKPAAAPTTATVDVPGTIEPFLQTAVNARATGYADKVLVDIGDRVTAGQTLAVITAPDTDQETAQAHAQLIQEEAAFSQSQATELSSQETVAQDQANVLQARSALETAESDLAQLRDELAEAQRARGEQVANLSEANANLDLDRLTNIRNQNLADEGFVSRATADEFLAAYKVGVSSVASAESSLAAADSAIEAAEAGVQTGIHNVHSAQYSVQSSEAALSAAEETDAAYKDAVNESLAGVNADVANLKRTMVLQNFENVVAPFSGVVTARNIDPGAYIAGGSQAAASTSVGSSSAGAGATGASAGGSSSGGSAEDTSSSSSGSSGGLFTVADLKRLRIYINLPQDDAGLLQDGDSAKITVPSASEQAFTGLVVHSTVALDPTSRTLIAEIQVDNPNGILRPGMFSDVQITVPQPSGILLVPDSALVTGTNGTQLTLVEPGNKLHFQDVTVGNDDGKNLQILSGLKLTDRVVSSPANGFAEGEKVQVVKPTRGKKSPATTGSTPPAQY